MGFLHHPQHVGVRKAIFQIHLWVGVALSLYLSIMGITGSILVFEKEIEHAAYPQLWHAPAPPQSTRNMPVDFTSVIASVKSTYPHHALSVAYPPDKPGDNYEVFLYQDRHFLYVFVDPNTAHIVGTLDPDKSWLMWVIDLHFHLLAGKTGTILNGVGAACLPLMSITGLIIWWAGLRNWTRGLTVNFHARWKRINFDLHSAIGSWTLAIVFMWAATGVYLAWPRSIESMVNHFSSIASARPPTFKLPAHNENEPWASWQSMIQQAQQVSPNATFAGAFFPRSANGALTLLMARGDMRNFNCMDYLYLDPVSGKQLAIWHRGINPTSGGKLIFWLSPLHFGSDWGLMIKILWAAFGCSLPLLSITGAVMFWNRSLSKKWKQLQGNRN